MFRRIIKLGLINYVSLWVNFGIKILKFTPTNYTNLGFSFIINGKFFFQVKILNYLKIILSIKKNIKSKIIIIVRWIQKLIKKEKKILNNFYSTKNGLLSKLPSKKGLMTSRIDLTPNKTREYAKKLNFTLWNFSNFFYNQLMGWLHSKNVWVHFITHFYQIYT